MDKLTLNFGAFQETIRIQLSSQGFIFDEANVENWQRLSKAITLLGIHSLISRSEVIKAEKRLIKKIKCGISK